MTFRKIEPIDDSDGYSLLDSAEEVITDQKVVVIKLDSIHQAPSFVIEPTLPPSAITRPWRQTQMKIVDTQEGLCLNWRLEKEYWYWIRFNSTRLSLFIYACRFGEQFGYNCEVWDQGIYGGIAGWSECVHNWSIWCWVLRELSCLKWKFTLLFF
nr:hypothetical protein CFP56_53445 [Quercus suber]